MSCAQLLYMPCSCGPLLFGASLCIFCCPCQAAAVSAAHASIGSVLATLCSKGHPELAESALPYYIQRALEEPQEDCTAQMGGLAMVLPLLLPVLPPGSRTALHAVRLMVGICRAWLHEEAAAGAAMVAAVGGAGGVASAAPEMPTGMPPAQGGRDGVLAGMGAAQAPGQPGMEAPQHRAARRLAGLAMLLGPSPVQSADAQGSGAQQAGGTGQEAMSPAVHLAAIVSGLVMVVDYNLLPEVAELVGGLLRSAPAAAQGPLMQAVHDGVVRSDDYARKTSLVKWLQGVLPVGMEVAVQS